ncbi:MAG: ABC transporter permease [Crocinitomicaceae bacterium]|nr:ABC transporter permease [Crocinitomicaceae bacterium]|tara:strand:+ start:508 stop:1848 length:1341 start_codon:yes stop_codon:yes gene_type:complete
MNKIWLIVEREYLTRVRKMSFILITLLGPIALALGLSVIIYLSLSEDVIHKVLIVDEKAPAFNSISNTQNIKFNYANNMDLQQSKEMFYDSDYSCILYIPKNIEAGNIAILYYKKQPSASVIRGIEDKVEAVVEELKLDQYKIDRKEFYDVKTNFTLNPVKYSETGDEEELDKGATYIGFGFGILIYMFIFLYGVQVMRGVIEEKTNRIVEVIITSVRPFHLMMGKIIGVGLVSLTQIVLWITLTLGIFGIAQATILDNYYSPEKLTEQVQATPEVMEELQAEGAAKSGIMDPNSIINRTNWTVMISLFLFYFFGGYFLYSALFAAVGAAVDNETDTQQFMIPITAPLGIAYIFSAAIIKNPEGPIAFWLSIFPLTSPIIMLVRVALGVGEGGIPIWEVALSMVLLVLGFILVVWIAAKIYRVGILMYGKKPSYKELWKWLRYSNK